jgi:hypothetical protein
MRNHALSLNSKGYIVFIVITILYISPPVKLTADDAISPDGLYGIWVQGDEKYDMRQDGTILYWEKSKSPIREGRFVIEKIWKDADGKTWFHLKEKWSEIPYDEKKTTTWYITIIVAADGRTSDQGGSMMMGYLDEPDPTLFFPDTYTRQ